MRDTKNRPTDQPTNRPTDQPTNRPTNQLANQLHDHIIVQALATLWAKIPTISSHDTMSDVAAATFHVLHTGLMSDDMMC
jgi:hypothetical protein